MNKTIIVFDHGSFYSGAAPRDISLMPGQISQVGLKTLTKKAKVHILRVDEDGELTVETLEKQEAEDEA